MEHWEEAGKANKVEGKLFYGLAHKRLAVSEQWY